MVESWSQRVLNVLCGDDRRQHERDAGDSRNDKAADCANLFVTSTIRVSSLDLISHLVVDPRNEGNAQLH